MRCLHTRLRSRSCCSAVRVSRLQLAAETAPNGGGSDRVCGFVARLSQLQELAASRARVTPRGLALLGTLPRLRDLTLLGEPPADGGDAGDGLTFDAFGGFRNTGLTALRLHNFQRSGMSALLKFKVWMVKGGVLGGGGGELGLLRRARHADEDQGFGLGGLRATITRLLICQAIAK
jgi:hypothetical protein